jgi:hypothetical protein
VKISYFTLLFNRLQVSRFHPFCLEMIRFEHGTTTVLLQLASANRCPSNLIGANRRAKRLSGFDFEQVQTQQVESVTQRMPGLFVRGIQEFRLYTRLSPIRHGKSLA